MFFSSSVLEYLPLILYILGYHENRGLRIHPINKRLQVDFFFAPENTKQAVLPILHLNNVCYFLTIIPYV